MFEDSLFASKAAQHSARPRWSAVSAVALQAVLAGALLLAPMLRPLALPALRTAPPVVSVNLRPVEITPKPQPIRVRAAADSMLHAPASVPSPQLNLRPAGDLLLQATSADIAPALALSLAGGMGAGMGSGTGLGLGLGSGGPAAPTVHIQSARPLRLSSGVTSGMLLAPMRPLYPAIARAAGVQGTVVLSARIDRNGRIAGLQVVSGPEMLRSAALDAVREARYRPYLLNGDPTEVETTIVVNFRMGG